MSTNGRRKLAVWSNLLLIKYFGVLRAATVNAVIHGDFEYVEVREVGASPRRGRNGNRYRRA